ncbi:MAG: cyclic nucleotide-binding domain-containing protein, partial [Methyloceanibacter sp.]
MDVPPDEFFVREHDQAASMFVLEAGKVAVLKSWRGREYLLRTLKERDCFGEMAMMDLFPRSASVRAVADCTAIRLSAANLHQVYEQDLKQFALIQMNMGREVTRRLREADNQLFRATMGPGRGHRARFPARGRALAAMVGLTPPPPMIGSAKTSKPIYFESLDNCAYIIAKAEHSARTSVTPGCPLRVKSRPRHVRYFPQSGHSSARFARPL